MLFRSFAEDFPGTETHPKTITRAFICGCVYVCVGGCGEQARVMATIGVTRGLGDHDLKVYNSNIYIKPFLSCVPEVGGTTKAPLGCMARFEFLIPHHNTHTFIST